MKRKVITTIMMMLLLASISVVVFETMADPEHLLYYDDGECDLAYPAIQSGQYLRQRFLLSDFDDLYDFDIYENCLVEEVQIFWYGTVPDFTGVIKLRDHDTGDLVTAANLADVQTDPPGEWGYYDVSGSGFVSDHFYVELWQTSPSGFGGYIMGDTDNPRYMSEVSTDGGENWVVWSIFNYMIRVKVTHVPAGTEIKYDDGEFDGLYYQIKDYQYLRQRFLVSDSDEVDGDCLVETVLISWLGTVPDFTGVIKLRDYDTGELVTVSNLANIPTGSGPPNNWYNYYVAEAGFVSDHFYVELWQTSPSGFGGYIRTDLTVPEGMSETSYNSGETWYSSSTMNFMIRVTVSPIDDIPPVADAGPDQTVNEDALVTFDGSGSSDNVGVVSYDWEFMDVDPQSLAGVNPTYTFTDPGVYEVTLTVSDAQGNEAVDTVIITVQTPEERAERLVKTIETWNLPEGTENSLTSKLEAAIHLLNPNNEIGAVNKLLDFIHQVEVLTDKKLTVEQANYLIAEAQGIINNIQE